ncbi:MAG: hypothetical protein CVU84_06700 [Firmicutes bacterium HGW-Firmicutes-1]|jgi:Flp pilus assembly protein TadB|nr:MAG: hypothetical protein CVU84_06700 [Firmicutes bacterium HGW-Firmicutes-1]
MTKYMREHESYLLDAMKQNDKLVYLLEYHNRQIKWLQHERIVHLLVMIFTALLFVFSFVGMILMTNLFTLLLVLLLGVLTVTYIIHYYVLENTVQRWYKISNSLNQQIDAIGVNLHTL